LSSTAQQSAMAVNCVWNSPCRTSSQKPGNMQVQYTIHLTA
jgi:hypothetical protein